LYMNIYSPKAPLNHTSGSSTINIGKDSRWMYNPTNISTSTSICIYVYTIQLSLL